MLATRPPRPGASRAATSPTRRAAGLAPKPILKSDRETGAIRLGGETTLEGFPDACWDHRLGNRCGIEWVLDRRKEKTPRDATIHERFDTYRFADRREKVADLLPRVARVSVETMEIVAAMREAASA